MNSVLSTSCPVILHVDDDATSQIMAEGPLVEAGFMVLQASDGAQAIELFELHSPDLVIMDAVMPVMDGFDAIAHIRQTASGKHVPILMTTGLDDLESIRRAYDEGATDFLTKPVNFFILPYRLQYMLRSKDTADELRASQARLDDAQRIARVGHWEWDINTGSANWSRELARIFGLNTDVLSGSWESLLNGIDAQSRSKIRASADSAISSARAFKVEIDVVGNRENDRRMVRLEAEPRLDKQGNCTHMLGTVQDVTESADAQKEIHDLAYYDLITGLPNRVQLSESLTKTLNISERIDSKFALLFLDLDHFKQVNDSLGHDAGDDLLQQVSQRLSCVLRESDVLGRPKSVSPADQDEEGLSGDTVARIGGDEFVVLLDNITRAEDAGRVAERIAASISLPYVISDIEVAVTTSVGISVFPEDGRDAETLMKHADVAMYHAKENGRNGYQFYSRAIHEKALSRFSMEKELKHAIDNNQLTLRYQPKISVSDGQTVGVEALVRWNHPERGPISPTEFIPIAEDTGLIMPLGRWVLQESTRQMQDWITRGFGAYSVAVNCSPNQFTRGDLVGDIDVALQESGLEAGLLEIEMTENLFLHNIENGIGLLSRLKSLGVQIAIDDFGTGISSLSYLKRLPVDKIKIDQSFVQEIHHDKGDAAIVLALITLGRNLGLSVVAEGIENDQQLAVLRAYECTEVQGYYFSAPLTAEQFERWLQNQQPPLKTAAG